MKLWARFKRFWHCLRSGHCAVDVRTTDLMGRHIRTYTCCECGRIFE